MLYQSQILHKTSYKCQVTTLTNPSQSYWLLYWRRMLRKQLHSYWSAGRSPAHTAKTDTCTCLTHSVSLMEKHWLKNGRKKLSFSNFSFFLHLRYTCVNFTKWNQTVNIRLCFESVIKSEQTLFLAMLFLVGSVTLLAFMNECVCESVFLWESFTCKYSNTAP